MTNKLTQHDRCLELINPLISQITIKQLLELNEILGMNQNPDCGGDGSIRGISISDNPKWESLREVIWHMNQLCLEANHLNRGTRSGKMHGHSHSHHLDSALDDVPF